MKIVTHIKNISKKNIWNLCKQFVKFGIVGLSNTLISLFIYYLFISFDKSLYIWGNTIGFVVSVMNAYYWNNKYVFKKTEKGNLKPLIRSFAVYGLTFLVSTGLLFIMVRYLKISEVVAPLINLLVTIPLNFLLNKFWTFK